MKKIFVGLACVLSAMAFLTSCAGKDEFVGTWQSLKPVDISKQIPSAAEATSLMSVTFGPDSAGTGGNVMFSSLINVTQSVDETPDIVSPYEVSVAATATVNGKWMYDHGDDDELILSFDENSICVNVDNTGVTFRENVLTGTQEPVTDSLTQATAKIWREELTSVIRKNIGQFNRIEDVKVKNDKGMGRILKFETDRPDRTYVFREVE